MACLKGRINYFLVIVGLLLITASVLIRVNQSRRLSFNGNYPPLEITDEISNNPVRIVIPSLNIDLAVFESQIADGIWQISEKGASHLNISTDPGVLGNMVIYAHNKKNLFGPILRVVKDTMINVVDEAGVRHSYTVVDIKIVTPSDIDYVLPKSEEVLTLYTCTGFADSRRFIVIAKPE